MSGVGEGAPGEDTHGLPPADTMEVVDSADSGPLGEAMADIEAQGPSSSCTATSETSAGAVGVGAEQAVGTTSVEGDASGVVEELSKVTVFNVGMHATNAQLEKLLKKNGIAYKRARKPPSISHAILTFETEDQRTSGMEKIGKLRGPRGGELMYAVLTKHNTKKRGAEGGRGGDGSKRPRQEEAKTVAQATASLYGVKTYAEQLAFKEQTLMEDLFFRLPALVRKEWDKRYGEWKRNQGIKHGKQTGGGGGGGDKLASPPELKCPSWCRTFKRRNGTVPFDVLPIVPSREQDGYRNKCEFTIGLGADGLATTGFRSGRFNADVTITVESPKDCPQVHRDMKTLCVQMDAFMRTSPFLPYEDTSKKGVWRFLLVRRSVADNETMAKLVVNLTGVAETEEWKKEEQRLVKELSEGAQGQEGTRVVSLWIQEYAGVSSPDETSPLRLLWGKERIEEKLFDLRFTISPNSFFQVNTQGAEALYRVVIENLELGDDVMVLDVCCGAGTIGICAAAAGGAKRVFGADLCLPAIEDAKVNAEANGLKNCEFLCGKAEAVVGSQIARAIKQHKEESRAASAAAAAKGSKLAATADGAPPKEPLCSELKFAAVLDPPRSGVHAKCLRSLRGTKAIKKLVYVSCNPTKSLPADALILCCPVSNSTVGVPFRPVKAIPVDMFPHTPHMELVMVFERIEPETEQASPSAAEPAAQPDVKPAEATVTGGASPDAPPGEGAHHSSGSPPPAADQEAGEASGAGEAGEATAKASDGVKASETAARASEIVEASEAANAVEAAHASEAT